MDFTLPLDIIKVTIVLLQVIFFSTRTLKHEFRGELVDIDIWTFVQTCLHYYWYLQELKFWTSHVKNMRAECFGSDYVVFWIMQKRILKHFRLSVSFSHSQAISLLCWNTMLCGTVEKLAVCFWDSASTSSFKHLCGLGVFWQLLGSLSQSAAVQFYMVFPNQESWVKTII